MMWCCAGYVSFPPVTSLPPGTPSTTTTRAGGGGGGDAHESEQSLLSFAGSELLCHLCHIYNKRAESTEGLLTLLYDRVDVGVSRLDLARIFIVLGVNPGGGGA